MRPLLRATRPRQPWLLPRHPRSTPQSLVPRRIATTCARNPAPVDLPRLVVKHGSKGHNSLATFIKYAARTKLRPATPVFVGTHYEYTTALSLMRLGFSLLRTGAPNDAGIDLIGHWVLAPLSEPLPIIVQCKARQHTLAPAAVRELEGSFRGIPPDWKSKPVLGLLVTEKKATKGTLAAMGQSPWPMGFVMMSRHGLIQQFVWNRAASERGLQGVGVTLRHTPRALLSASELLAEDENEEATPKRSSTASKFANTGTQKDIQMTWMGSPIFTERNTLDQDTLDLIRLAKPKRSAGRPRKEIVFDAGNLSKNLTATSGRPRTMHLEPSPRGGQIDPPLPPKAPRPRGRPKGSKNKVKKSKEAD